MKEKFEELNAEQIDALREVGNIGAGNSGITLSEISNETINLDKVVVKALDYTELVDSVGGPESIMVGLISMLTEEVSGVLMLLMPEDGVSTIANEWLGMEINNVAELDDTTRSVVKELANIIKSSYLSAISNLTGLKMGISAPSVCVDMIGSILDVPENYFAEMGEKIITIEDDLSSEKWKNCKLILMLETESLRKLMESLGLI